MRIKKLNLADKNAGILSPLEHDVLCILWSNRRKKMTAREIYGILVKKGKKVALSSVAVILERLYKKKIVSRRAETGRGGKHYIYSAITKTDFEEMIVKTAVDKLIERFGSLAVNYFNEKIGKKKTR